MRVEPADRTRGSIRVAVTREEGEDGPLSRALRARGATVLGWPATRTAAPEDPSSLERALAGAERFDWLVLTSRRAIGPVAERLGRLPDGLRVAMVGDSTGAAAEAAGWTVDVRPEESTGRGLLAALEAAGVGPGSRVLFPASELAAATIPEGLRSLGAEVVRVTAYRTLPADLDRAAIRSEVERGVDVVTFTSPSAIGSLRSALGAELFDRLVTTARVAAIGPTTGAAAEAAGAKHVIQPAEPSFEALADTVAAVAAGIDA